MTCNSVVNLFFCPKISQLWRLRNKQNKKFCVGHVGVIERDYFSPNETICNLLLAFQPQTYRLLFLRVEIEIKNKKLPSTIQTV